MNRNKIFACLIALAFPAYLLAQDTLQHMIPGRTNAKQQQKKPYVILISADGFRADLADKYHASNLLRLRAKGVQADYMQSSYPSLTFPNHYTMVTGMYPSHHGLVDNSFFDKSRDQLYTMGNKKEVADSSWYGGRPLWVLAEQQQMLSASFYWVASESAIMGTRPSYYYVYNDKIGIEQRLNTVKEWLKMTPDIRPHMITFYLPEVDHAEHTYGAESPQAAEAVKFVDDAIGKMVSMVDSLKLNVNFIFVSDHGMTTVDNNKAIALPAAIDTTRFYVPFGEALLHLYAKDPSFVQPTYLALKAEAKDYDVYRANNVPKRYHYGSTDDRFHRIGDIVLIPHPPAFFNIGNRPNKSIGKHGFDPALKDMHAVFYAWGPSFKKHMKVKSFENVHLYPLIAHVLQLKYDESSIDGRFKVLQAVLK